MKFLFFLVPTHILSKLIGYLANANLGFIKKLWIKIFIRLYKINLGDFEKHKIEDYKSFNEFFTRSLATGTRPVSRKKGSMVAPCDGTLVQSGKINHCTLIQAKNKTYTLSELLASNVNSELEFNFGDFHVFYLAPRDYHRVHMPLAGTVVKMTYIPGNLFSVNNKSIGKVNNLYARNERLVIYFKALNGKIFVMVMVGAIFVSSIETKWQGLIAPVNKKKIQHWIYEDQHSYSKAEQVAHFNMGSTVILITAENDLNFKDNRLELNSKVKMGEFLAEFN